MDELIDCSKSIGRTEEMNDGVCSKALLEMIVDMSAA
jgi:hypothetical protein